MGTGRHGPLKVGSLVVCLLVIVVCWASATGQVIARVSVSSAGQEANGDSGQPSLSADGAVIAFLSQATNLIAGGSSAGIHVRDRRTACTMYVSGGQQLEISGDGRLVAVGTGEDILLHNVEASETRTVSRHGWFGKCHWWYSDPTLDGSGTSLACTRLECCRSGSDFYDCWRWIVWGDLPASSNLHLPLGTDFPSESQKPTLSGNGRFIAFLDSCGWPPDRSCHVWRYDRQTATTVTVSLSTAGGKANGGCRYPCISADGRYVGFESDATNLVPKDGNGCTDVFLRDCEAGETVRVSVSGGGQEANDHSDSPSISADGRFVAFASTASNLVAGDTNGRPDVFLHDRHTGQTVRVSMSWTGAQGRGASWSPCISANGRLVAFASRARNLVPDDTNGCEDIFIASNPLSTAPGLAPTLSWLGDKGYRGDGVHPACGRPHHTQFSFKVRLTDLDGPDPEYVRLVLRRNGESWRSLGMQAGSEPIGQGRVYTTSLELPPGSYAHRFRAKDADGVATGEATEWTDGPYVEPPPTLSWLGTTGYEADGVDPDPGVGGDTRFRFKVLYSDADGHEPRYVSLHLRRNGKPFWEFAMVRGVGDYTKGRVYRRTRKLPPGNYEHCFKARDRDGLATGEATDWTPGPVVGPRTSVALSSLSAVPTNAGAQITFSLSSAAQVQARILNIAGRPVKTLCHAKDCEAGSNTLLWNAMSDQGLAVPSGTYLVEVIASGANGAQARRLTQVRIHR